MARKKAMAAAAAQGQSAPGIADAAAGASLGGAAGAAPAAAPAPLPVTAAPMKNGRKVKKMNTGGTCS
jgi:hypothetical protein